MATSDDVTPPHSIEAEMAVLGSMLVERNAIIKAADVLKPTDFYREAHRTVYNAILELSNNNVEADVITVGEALKADRFFTDAGGAGLLVELAERVPTALHVDQHGMPKLGARALVVANALLPAEAGQQRHNQTRHW